MYIVNKTDPVISVIVCTYNQEETIVQTIESILNQLCSYSYEIIIGDDLSNDNTREICISYKNKYPDKIILVLHERNGGVVKNWLSCLEISRGKYVTTCAGDDFWHNKEKLQLQVDFMENNPECGILHTDFDELNSISNKTVFSHNKTKRYLILEGRVQNLIFNGKLKICAPTICYRKKLLDDYVPFEKYIELNFPIEDWPTNLIISHYANVNYLDISTVTYRKGHESISNPNNYEKISERFKHEIRMYQFVCSLFPKELIYDENGYKIYIQSVLLNLAYKRNDFKKAKQFAIKMMKLGDKSLKVRMATNWFGFILFKALKKINNLYI